MIKKIINSTLIKSSGIYMITSIINKAIPFALLPILTIYLTPEDYGIVSMFSVLIGLFSPIVIIGLHGSISRKFFDNIPDYSRFITTGLYIMMVAVIILSLGFYIFSTAISEYSAFPKNYLFLVILAIIGQSINKITLSLWRVREQAVRYGVFEILLTAFNLSLTLYFVINLNLGWLGQVLGQTIAFVIFSLLGLIIIVKRENLTFSGNKKYAKEILHYGIPLIPHALGMFLITMTDRIFITNMVGLNQTGIYTVGFQIGLGLKVITESFNSAWLPYLYKKLKLGDMKNKRLIVKITYIYFVGIIIVALALSLIAPIIIYYLIDESFHRATIFVPWIAFGFAFNGMYTMVAGVIFYKKKTGLLAIVTFVTALLNLIFNYLFISWNGAVGAAQSTCLAFFVSFILTWVLASRVYKMPWNIIKYEMGEDKNGKL